MKDEITVTINGQEIKLNIIGAVKKGGNDFIVVNHSPDLMIGEEEYEFFSLIKNNDNSISIELVNEQLADELDIIWREE